MREASVDVGRLKAVIFDLDGTLYRQAPLRRAMALRLLRAHLLRPAEGVRTMRAISAYRRAQEQLRGAPCNGDLAEAQLEVAAAAACLDRDAIAAAVANWIEQAPLDILPRYLQPGLVELLTGLRSRGLKLGVLSDYQPGPKLRALGIADHFDVVLCAQESDIGLFKPHPRGLEVALQMLDVIGPEALYVGDRAEVDAAAAAAANVPCAILSKSRKVGALKTFVQISCFSELQLRLEPA